MQNNINASIEEIDGGNLVEDGLTNLSGEKSSLPIKAWYVAKCGGEKGYNGCGKYFNMLVAKSDSDGYMICPHCGWRN